MYEKSIIYIERFTGEVRRKLGHILLRRLRILGHKVQAAASSNFQVFVRSFETAADSQLTFISIRPIHWHNVY